MFRITQTHRISLLSSFTFGLFVLGCSGAAVAQMTQPTGGPLDPARDAVLRRVPPSHEVAQFIWTADDAAARDPKLQASVRGQDDKTEPHYFRAHFQLSSVPRDATLYIAGPRSATVVLNGQEVLRAVDDGTRPKNLSVMTSDVVGALHPGDNVIAIEEVRGHSSLHTGASPTINQITYGEVLAVKIVPASLGVDAKPVLASDPSWRSTLHPGEGRWEEPAYDDAEWKAVQSLGVLGSRRDFLQWNADAGLYAWPGYSGISDALRVFDVPPVTTKAVGSAVLFDFGREMSARVRLRSAGANTMQVLASYGESPEEALKDKSYLGVRTVIVPATSEGYGPKSAFRYVKLTPVTEDQSLAGVTAVAEAITYPVAYTGSFASSDPTLNRIWETAAYTARLCMQEGIWDAPKRDRGRWMGDLDVTGRTLSAVFGGPETNALLEQTMTEIIGASPVTRDVNTIAGYSALWITGEANFYRHSGDKRYLQQIHRQLLELLTVMDGELDSTGLFTNPDKHKVFVDWSASFSADTPEARAATHLEFTSAYQEAAYLLSEMGDSSNAARYGAAASRLRKIAQEKLLDQATQTFGDRWQTNAMAVVSGAADGGQREAIWRHVLAHVGEPSAVITPYYGYYVLSAMARVDHRPEALSWMRQYWGGMLEEGATSFWEAYDPHWPKQDFHAFLEADGKRGYYVSLAHGWSSGPAAWLMEEILGIAPTAAGFSEVTIRPDLAGLAWARGAEPTPHGPITVDLTPTRLKVAVPPGTRATVQIPFGAEAARVRLNGHPLPSTTLSADGRLQVVLDQAGTYTLEAR